LIDLILAVLLDGLISGALIWVAGKITSVDIRFFEVVISVVAAAVVAIVASFLALPPVVGWLSSVIVLFYLLKKYSQASIWPDLILMVLISKIVAMLVSGALNNMFSG